MRTRLQLLACSFLVACTASNTADGPPTPTALMAFQSVRQAVQPSLGTPPSEIVQIPHQESLHPAAMQPVENFIGGTWFEDRDFTPGIHLGQLEDGTGIVELGWRTSWFQSYHMVFMMSPAGPYREVTHLGLLSNGDAGNEWMRIESARISLFEDDQQLQLRFQISGDWEYNRDLTWFGGSVTFEQSTMAELGLTDPSWGSFEALNDLLGTRSPFAWE